MKLYLLTFLLCLSSAHAILPKSIKVSVVDEKGTAIPSATVRVGWTQSGGWSGSPKSDSKEGTTDKNGSFNFLGRTKGDVGIYAEKEGYYGTYMAPSEDNPTLVTLRKKQNPIPMYAKRAKIDFPAGEGDFGYDLSIGDLVEPHGKGIHADIIFRLSTTEKPWRDGRIIYSLHGDIVFENPEDGLAPVFIPIRAYPQSVYKMPFRAPVTGYQHSLNAAFGIEKKTEYYSSEEVEVWHWFPNYYPRKEGSFFSHEVNAFIRVRSETEAGSMYGFLRGIPSFIYRGDDIPSVSFDYFLNPDGTTNIEFNPEQNLISEFKKFENKPRYP
jgi:hypothetical protein